MKVDNVAEQISSETVHHLKWKRQLSKQMDGCKSLDVERLSLFIFAEEKFHLQRELANWFQKVCAAWIMKWTQVATV
nr:hypothetical transcript [Hymenolepis microstoma]